MNFFPEGPVGTIGLRLSFGILSYLHFSHNVLFILPENQINDGDSSSGRSLDGSFRRPRSGLLFRLFFYVNSSSKFIPTSKRVYKVLKDYAAKLVDLNLFTQCVEDWVLENLHTDSYNHEQYSNTPFQIDELCTLDFALEGVLFQQLFRMPCSPHISEDHIEDELLALEDFLHTVADGLWHTFWHKNKPLPFFVSFPRYPGSKFYSIEKAISRGRLKELSALFYAIHILLARSLSRSNAVSSYSVYVLVLDSKFASVVKLGGDLGNLEVDLNNPYQSVAEWIKFHAEVSFSPVEQIWNKLGNVNWRDMGTLQLLLATFNCIAQWIGPPRKSIASLAADHSLRLQKRRVECRLIENENALIPYQATRHDHGEIDEILVVEDHLLEQRSFQIHECLLEGNCCSYTAVALAHPTELLMLHIVQRQTKVLNILKEQGITSKSLPEIIASGKILHSGPCEKQSPKGCCDHPWCGTPILVTCPVGETLSSILAHHGPFSAEEATRCCRDCLAALRSAKMANIQHGNICPENIICVSDSTRGSCLYVLVSWGRAILEDRDSPAINLQFSSAHALQNAKLCPSSDAESLIYLIYFICGGNMQQQDSIESALQWRQRCWAKRLIQQRLGEVSALLKAFADYVDSLCGTPYPVDYDTWLKRLSRAVDNSIDRGKTIDEVLRIKDTGETSGTSGGGNSSTC
ncbi:unnamed protein product [Coffea canephora]|uniref:Protein kinase domain-containing protein n=1 Tax=Coffea canephora TaxID=49390 RepID=A0A068UIV1_COFCA|nr:unnamed protein product [Coffea canephora]